MATYSDLVPDKSNDGWSVSYKIEWPTSSSPNYDNVTYYNNIGNYNGPTGASWYQQTWWQAYNTHGPQLWAKIFHNETGQDLVLAGLSFLSCAANSGGVSYYASGGTLSDTRGKGATFKGRYYVASNNSEYTESDDSFSVPDVNVENASPYAGRYKISDLGYTVHPYFGGCQSGYYVGNDELLNYVTDVKYGPNTCTLNFTHGINIPNGDYAFVVLEVTDWHGGDSQHQTLVVLGDSPYFTTELVPNEEPYIWRMTDLGNGEREWQRTRYPFMWSGTEWVKMSEENAEEIVSIIESIQ